jgi:hypothetical protein
LRRYGDAYDAPHAQHTQQEAPRRAVEEEFPPLDANNNNCVSDHRDTLSALTQPQSAASAFPPLGKFPPLDAGGGCLSDHRDTLSALGTHTANPTERYSLRCFPGLCHL